VCVEHVCACVFFPGVGHYLTVQVNGIHRKKKGKLVAWTEAGGRYAEQENLAKGVFSFGIVANVLDYDFVILTMKRVSGNVDGCVGGTDSHTDGGCWCHPK